MKAIQDSSADEVAVVARLLRRALGREASEAELLAVLSGLRGEAGVGMLKQLAGGDAYGRVPLFVPPGHFYSPIVDPAEAREMVDFGRHPASHEIPGVNLDMDAMREMWRKLLPRLQDASFPDHHDERMRYYFENPFYSYADALVLRAMLLHFLPQRLITVGAGFSSAVIMDVLLDEVDTSTDITLIDPFPQVIRKLMLPGDMRNITLMEQKVQTVNPAVFAPLRSGDVLFIDSTHVLRTGSDVWYLFQKILPALAPGVVVHVHDIFWPFEYPEEWVMQDNRSWNETYILHAFLTHNDAFEILFWNDAFLLFAEDQIRADCPKFLRNSGGSFWMRRRA